MSGDDATELGRELRIVNSMLDPRINQAIAKKYVVRPRFRSYPATFEYAVETMHSEPPSCIRCLDILYEIQAPKEVIDGYHVPTDPSGVGLSCKVKISFASNQQDDEAFIDEIKHSYCFESLGNQTQHPKMTDSFLGDTTRD